MTDFVTIKGNLGADPKYSSRTGVPVARFNVGSTERRFNRASREWEDGHTNWHRIVVFRDQARNVAVSLGKGAAVVIHGRIRNRRVNQGTDAEPKWTYFSEIEADHVGVDLTRGYVNFFRGVAAEPPLGEGDGQPGPVSAPADPPPSVPGDGSGEAESAGQSPDPAASTGDWGTGFVSPSNGSARDAELDDEQEDGGDGHGDLDVRQAA
ncbi:single-stranded DNA-binding protein [Zhihengliuella salsuginis]|uniref:Single-stranded DNA-binding protein n=1 Tax=Zhihengliuella salsuginis TaxID=578222 RepID=A0ABQ3GDV0_9MICC|nr:single-stranded DNA-binding protein [Zhihengliuella salsuginis]GHD01758.1 hypothetical protein GCM10008096_06240 [Zhihengliuella salsuginis]